MEAIDHQGPEPPIPPGPQSPPHTRSPVGSKSLARFPMAFSPWGAKASVEEEDDEDKETSVEEEDDEDKEAEENSAKRKAL